MLLLAAPPQALAQPPEANPPRATWLLLDGRASFRPIVLPADPVPEPILAAARTLRAALAESSGAPAGAFPLRGTSRGPAIRLEVRAAPDRPLDRSCGYDVARDGVRLWARSPEDFPLAVSWFLERELSARWFSPGPLGRELPRHYRVHLHHGSHEASPSFLSRRMSGVNDVAWETANRLASLLPHGHTASSLVTPEEARANPSLAPVIDGRKLAPAPHERGNWQPDLTAEATVAHVAAKLAATFRTEPARVAAAFGQNDTWKWDQSDATLAAVAPHRHFRHYPVYSDTLFGFLNRLATRLEGEFPDRLITTYSYQWTEQVPQFPVHRNVVPFLTADRSQWFDPAFKAEDQDLIRRWVQAGPRVVGAYDYYYGAPFLVPRPTLSAVAESIPFLHRAGVRAFYAEVYPNWALDGPKAWLAAQLLWDATQDPQALLDDYFARYWKEAAAPMRRFFAICDRQYLGQPRPGYWIKFFKDDHQRILFPPDVRRELFACLDEAAALSRQPVVRARLAATRAAFEVSDLFCRHDEARDALARLAAQPAADPVALSEGIRVFTESRLALQAAHARVKREHPRALSADLIGEYLRNDPRPRALRRLAEATGRVPALDPQFVQALFAGRAPSANELTASGPELLADSSFSTLRKKSVHPFIALDWNEPGGPWVGKSEPFETLRIDLPALPGGERSLRYAGANQEGLYQTVRIEPGALHRISVRVRGKVSPGNMTFLFASLADRNGRGLGPGHIDRLPIGDFPEWTTLEMIVRAPADAALLGLGLRALYQVGDDYAEFASPSIQRLAAPSAAP